MLAFITINCGEKIFLILFGSLTRRNFGPLSLGREIKNRSRLLSQK